MEDPTSSVFIRTLRALHRHLSPATGFTVIISAGRGGGDVEGSKSPRAKARWGRKEKELKFEGRDFTKPRLFQYLKQEEKPLVFKFKNDVYELPKKILKHSFLKKIVALQKKFEDRKKRIFKEMSKKYPRARSGKHSYEGFNTCHVNIHEYFKLCIKYIQYFIDHLKICNKALNKKSVHAGVYMEIVKDVSHTASDEPQAEDINLLKFFYEVFVVKHLQDIDSDENLKKSIPICENSQERKMKKIVFNYKKIFDRFLSRLNNFIVEICTVFQGDEYTQTMNGINEKFVSDSSEGSSFKLNEDGNPRLFVCPFFGSSKEIGSESFLDSIKARIPKSVKNISFGRRNTGSSDGQGTEFEMVEMRKETLGGSEGHDRRRRNKRSYKKLNKKNRKNTIRRKTNRRKNTIRRKNTRRKTNRRKNTIRKR